MSAKQKLTVILSARGQVRLPRSIRDQRNWPAGTRLMVETISDGVLLTPAPVFASARPEDVFGSLHAEGPAKSVLDMKVGGRG